ncbi:organic cation transporter protein [Lingula anatina]|uniref:Organic cation transporter protein n=1 Tax=Lingula anatina TaxID=7574 RepID=A0A2R2MPF4_LINAN|nr:organic cation transporter protein [Lingula anatina]|eukprot:XP_023932063.1 organic cation transporter protein [Lingula anatina]
MNFDDFLKILGEFGTYQKQRCALICVVAFYSVISTLGVVFYGAEPFHHCKIPQERLEYVSRTYGNLSKEQLLDMNVPYTKYGKRNGCALYRMDITLTNGSISVFQNITAANSSTSGILQRLMTTSLESDVEYAQTVNLTTSSDSLWNSTVWKSQETYPCPVGRYYSTDEYQATIVSEFDLTCDNAWQLSTCSSVFFGGKLVAILVSGILSDRFGRRPIFLGSVVVLAASGIGLAFSPNMAVFCILYVIQGASDSSMYISLYTMGMELVGTKYRKLIGMGMAISFGLGHTLLALEAYFLRNWRYLALVACSPAVIIIFFYFVFNESVRWLLSRGRHKEAKRIITKAARINKIKLGEDTRERPVKEGDEEKQTKTLSAESVQDLEENCSDFKACVLQPQKLKMFAC